MTTSYEKIIPTDSSLRTAESLIETWTMRSGIPRTIAVAGESGSGKSVLATSLKMELELRGRSVISLHLDNYFKEIPEKNHAQRLRDISTIGMEEVNLLLLQEHVNAFLNREDRMSVPILSQDRKQFDTQELTLDGVEVLIIEGTYVFELKGLEAKVFMDADYRDTLERRKKRGRDTIDEFSEQVLAIEHRLIREHRAQAHVHIFNESISWLDC